MFSGILNFLFPSRCPLCGNTSDCVLYNPLCSACWSRIEKYTGPSCGICGIPVVSPLATLCESCMKEKPPYAKIFYYGIYEGALREAVHLLKFNGISRLAKPLGRLLAELPRTRVDAVVPVPLHPKRLLQREFNQAALIGRHLARRIQVPFLSHALAKLRDTPPQTEVSGKERLKNVRKAYRASDRVAGLELLLVDDVVTTGATVGECAKALMQAGAKSVTVAAAARSMPKQHT